MRIPSAVLAALAAMFCWSAPSKAAVELDPGHPEGIKLVNAQMARELATRATRLGTSSGTSDTTWVGYTPGRENDPGNWWGTYAGSGKDGFRRLMNGQPAKGVWDFEQPIHGDSLQGWWPLLNVYASTGGQTRTDRNRPWWALDFGNMANYVINQDRSAGPSAPGHRTFGVVGVWHRDGGSNAPAPVGLPTPNFTPPSGQHAAWMGLRAHGDNTYVDGKTGNPFNEDVLMFTSFGAASPGGNDQGFPGYGSQMDQMLYRDLDLAALGSGNLTIRFKFQTVMSTGIGTTASTRTGWFDADPLGYTGGSTNQQPNNFISSSDAGDSFAPRDSFMVYIGTAVDTNTWIPAHQNFGGPITPLSVHDPQRRWFGEVLHWDRDPLSNPANPQPLYYRELLSVTGDRPATAATTNGYVDTSFTIPEGLLNFMAEKNGRVRLVFRVKTNRGFDDQGSAYSSNQKGAAVVDRVSYQLTGGPEVVFGDFESEDGPQSIQNHPDSSAVDYWKSTGKPPDIFHHTHLFSDLLYQDLCGQKGDISRICDMSGIVISAGDHESGENAGGIMDGTAQRERNDGIMSPTIAFADDDANPNTRNVHGLYGLGGNGGVGDIDASADYYLTYEIYTGIMDPFTKGNLWRFACMAYPGNAKSSHGSYPAWGQMRFPGAIFFNPDPQCLPDLEPLGAFALLKTSNSNGIPDSLKMFLGKTQQCFRFGVSSLCSPTDGCYWDNISLALVDGRPAQLSVDIWNWINDAFPANESQGLPGSADFDTAGAHVMTGLNIAPSTSTNLRFDVPGDSVVISSSATTARVDMVFRILPGPGNYEPIGRPDLGSIRRIPQNPAIVTKGDGSWWDEYRQVPGDFASPGAVALHHNAMGHWDPNVWNSARCDTAEANLFALQGRGVPGGPLDLSAWMATLHESDPHFNSLGIPHNKCFVSTATASLSDIVCSGTVPQYLLDIGVAPSVGVTKEGTKIIPDGLLTPGAHVEYFFRDQKDDKAPGAIDGMVPDTNLVLQPIEGSTDGHRWQEFAVLPNAWKKFNYLHPVVRQFGTGPACLLVIDNNDRRGNERVWVGVSDTTCTTPQRYWGAHNGWHAVGGGDVDDPADNRRGKDNQPGFISEHIGQAGSGSAWDMYQVKASESLTAAAASLGSRLANRAGGAGQQLVIAKSSRQGPTPEMLDVYYTMMLFLSGDLNSGILGPYRNRSQNDAGIIVSWLQAGSTTIQDRGFWAIGDGFAESNVFGDKQIVYDFMTSFLGCDLLNPSWTYHSGDTRDLVDYRLLPTWQNKSQVALYGIRNTCLWTNDVLLVGGIGLPTLGSVTSEYYSGVTSGPAGVFKDWDPNSPWKSLVDGWDIEHLTSVGDVRTLDRSGYFYRILQNVWSKLCGVPGYCPYSDVPGGSGDFGDFVQLLGNPVRGPEATLRLGLSRPDRVEIKLYDVSGRLVRTLADRNFQAGEHTLVWDGLDGRGHAAPRGVYFARVQYRSRAFESTKKVIVLR